MECYQLGKKQNFTGYPEVFAKCGFTDLKGISCEEGKAWDTYTIHPFFSSNNIYEFCTNSLVRFVLSIKATVVIGFSITKLYLAIHQESEPEPKK